MLKKEEQSYRLSISSNIMENGGNCPQLCLFKVITSTQSRPESSNAILMDLVFNYHCNIDHFAVYIVSR